MTHGLPSVARYWPHRGPHGCQKIRMKIHGQKAPCQAPPASSGFPFVAAKTCSPNLQRAQDYTIRETVPFTSAEPVTVCQGLLQVAMVRCGSLLWSATVGYSLLQFARVRFSFQQFATVRCGSLPFAATKGKPADLWLIISHTQPICDEY